jgi:hypothetical protein
MSQAGRVVKYAEPATGSKEFLLAVGFDHLLGMFAGGVG